MTLNEDNEYKGSLFTIENNIIRSLIPVNDVYGKTPGEEVIKALQEAGDKIVMVRLLFKCASVGTCHRFSDRLKYRQRMDRK